MPRIELPHMAPRLTATGHRHSALANAVALRDVSLLLPRRIQLPYLPYHGFRQLGMTVAAPMSATPLRNHVSRVVRVRTQPQMLRTNARRIVAMVQHVHALGHRPHTQLVGHSVSPVCLAPHTEPPVTPGVCVCRPHPTLPRLVHLLPEALRHRTHPAPLRRERTRSHCLVVAGPTQTTSQVHPSL